LAYKPWSTVFPAACVAALIDRFAQHCRVADIDADSWRNKEAAERALERNRTPDPMPAVGPGPACLPAPGADLLSGGRSNSTSFRLGKRRPPTPA